MAKTKLKIGFDLDGVLAYNPIRIFRPFAAFLKFLVSKKKKRNGFYFPKTPLEQYGWKLLHQTSYKINNGYDELTKLVQENKVELYIITARYSFLKHDFDKWMKKLKAAQSFAGFYYNEHNQSPAVFKADKITKLDLDIFVEDNWGIIERLKDKIPKKTKVFWMSNYFDRHIPHRYKFFNLKTITNTIKKLC